MAYFDNTWTLTEQLFASLQGEATFYLQPYHQLRHPLIFYYGHVAALYVNKLRLAGLLERPVDGYLETLFETGVDEMSWDDTSQDATQWPAVSEVLAYRSKVYETVKGVIQTHPSLSSSQPRTLPEDTPLWALAMAFEHERIHLETSSVLMRELPLPLVCRPEGWAPSHPSRPESDTFSPKPGIDYPANAMVQVDAGTVELGKPREAPYFGWDNEYGEASRAVPAFRASKYKISNGEFLEFVRSGGYREQRYWSKDGWGWRTFRNAKWPTFWLSIGPANLHQYRLRMVHDVIPMPWAWPAEVNAHEASAYCKWRAEQEGQPAAAYRIISEAEHVRIREVCASAAAASPKAAGSHADRVLEASGTDFGSDGTNLNLAYSTPSPVDAVQREAIAEGSAPPPFGDPMGNVWEWCADDFHPLDGFRVHPLYDDFSTPCFDGAHNMIMGGSWASTGDMASKHARFHFRPHFFQHAGLRLVCADGEAAAGGGPRTSVVRLNKSSHQRDASVVEPPPPSVEHEGDGYESRKLLDEYMMLHFGAADDLLPFEQHMSREWLNFPQRCAQLVDAWASRLDLPKGRALDIGCAVGGSSFELARTYDRVIGVDLSASFIDAAQRMRTEGKVEYSRRDQGELCHPCTASVGDMGSMGDVTFEQADACAMPRHLGRFDACLLANLLCRLPSPRACLSRLGGPDGLVKPGGLAVVASPYTWMAEHTPKETWLGGFTTPEGEQVLSEATLRSFFDEIGFELLDEQDMPLLIREHKRKYQLIVSHAMIFRRRLDQ